jgi:hypothetical protein
MAMERMTFLTNVWLNHRPIGKRPAPDEVIGRMCGAAGGGGGGGGGGGSGGGRFRFSLQLGDANAEQTTRLRVAAEQQEEEQAAVVEEEAEEVLVTSRGVAIGARVVCSGEWGRRWPGSPLDGGGGPGTVVGFRRADGSCAGQLASYEASAWKGFAVVRWGCDEAGGGGGGGGGSSQPPLTGYSIGDGQQFLLAYVAGTAPAGAALPPVLTVPRTAMDFAVNLTGWHVLSLPLPQVQTLVDLYRGAGAGGSAPGGAAPSSFEVSFGAGQQPTLALRQEAVQEGAGGAAEAVAAGGGGSASGGGRAGVKRKAGDEGARAWND